MVGDGAVRRTHNHAGADHRWVGRSRFGVGELDRDRADNTRGHERLPGQRRRPVPGASFQHGHHSSDGRPHPCRLHRGFRRFSVHRRAPMVELPAGATIDRTTSYRISASDVVGGVANLRFGVGISGGSPVMRTVQIRVSRPVRGRSRNRLPPHHQNCPSPATTPNQSSLSRPSPFSPDSLSQPQHGDAEPRQVLEQLPTTATTRARLTSTVVELSALATGGRLGQRRAMISLPGRSSGDM